MSNNVISLSANSPFLSYLPDGIYTLFVECAALNGKVLVLRQLNKENRYRCDRALGATVDKILKLPCNSYTPILRDIHQYFTALKKSDSFFPFLPRLQMIKSLVDLNNIATRKGILLASEIKTLDTTVVNSDLEKVWPKARDAIIQSNKEKGYVKSEAVLNCLGKTPEDKKRLEVELCKQLPQKTRDHLLKRYKPELRPRFLFHSLPAVEIRDWVTNNQEVLSKITVLNLDNLCLRTFPQEICKLPLTSLSVLNNRISCLPPQIQQFTDLKVLYLAKNELFVLPPEMGKLTSMKSLNAAGNLLSDLPESMKNLTKMQDLYLGDSESLNPASLTNSQQDNVFTMNATLLGNAFKKVPPVIEHMSKLNTLDISGSKIQSLSDDLLKLPSLTSLNVSYNKISYLPRKISQLTSLEKFEASANRLSYLPDEIGQLPSLTELDLGKNRLRGLPDAFCTLTSLTTLLLFNNKLTQLPSNITQLANLQVVVLDNNQLTEIPKEIKATASFEGNPCHSDSDSDIDSPPTYSSEEELMSDAENN